MLICVFYYYSCALLFITVNFTTLRVCKYLANDPINTKDNQIPHSLV